MRKGLSIIGTILVIAVIYFLLFGFPEGKNPNREQTLEAMEQITADSSGMLLAIVPVENNDNAFDVIVSDLWYALPEHLKIRFASETHKVITQAMYDTGEISENLTRKAHVIFYDAFGERVARPSGSSYDILDGSNTLFN